MLLSDKVYDKAKWVAQILLPALATLYFALAAIWHLPKAEEVVGSITAVDAFLGLLLGISSKAYNASDAKYDGHLSVEDTEDGSQLRMKSVDHQALLTKDEITFKLTR